jgi:uncharacterized protein (TIGR03083 family)
MTPDATDLITALRTLHDDLAARALELNPEQLREGSYDTEWTVADVLSHLGSDAELALVRLRSDAQDSPSAEESAAVWAKWNARTPEQQAVEAIAIEEEYVAALEACDERTVNGLARELAGLDLDASHILAIRVAEQTMHGWDIAVAFDEDATLPAVGIPGTFHILWLTLRFATQPYDGELRVRVLTTDPDRDYVLEIVGGETRLNPSDKNIDTAALDGELQLPAEALLRLFYGRLDPRHTPPYKASDDTLLERLRALFKGI